MRTISLWQPWASLVVIGAKTWETRSWETGYRGPLAIHAAKKWTPEQVRLSQIEPFKSALAAAGLHAGNLPLGKVLGRVDLLTCAPIVENGIVFLKFSGNWCVPNPERAFGDFTEGRYAWGLKNPERLDTPIPERGRQRFWIFEYPAERIK